MQPEPRQRAIGAFEEFLNVPLEERLQQQQSRDPASVAIPYGIDALHALFHNVATTVPAYQNFLAALNINPESIQTFEDFQKLPLITKENYLRCYPLPQLCREGKLETCDFIAVSSGSTGNPTFWPRFISDELQIADRFEQIFHDSFFADSRRTLAVICFALGTWVGGMYTANCCRYLASKGYRVTVVTPGNNKTEIFRVVRELGEHFDQVVLLGYPPFIKDAIDSGIAAGVEWQKYRIKMVFAGEVFSEEWRSLVSDRINYHNTKEEGRRKRGRWGDGDMGRIHNYQFRITNYQLPITNYQLPTINGEFILQFCESLRYCRCGRFGQRDTVEHLHPPLVGKQSGSSTQFIRRIAVANAGTVRSEKPLF